MKIENLGSYELDIIQDIAYRLITDEEVDRMYLLNDEVELSDVFNAFLKAIINKEGGK